MKDDFGCDEATLLEAFDVILLNLVLLSCLETLTFKCEDDGGKWKIIISSELASSDLILIFSIAVEDFEEEGRERRRLPREKEDDVAIGNGGGLNGAAGGESRSTVGRGLRGAIGRRLKGAVGGRSRCAEGSKLDLSQSQEVDCSCGLVIYRGDGRDVHGRDCNIAPR